MKSLNRPSQITLFLVVGVTLLSLHGRSWVKGHGRLIDPPSRATMWRFGFDVPQADYDDNQGYCGGREQLWNRFQGRCGVCGDPWEPRPRAHERGGRYYDGTPVRYYTEGDVINVVMGITANHKGWVEFRLCPYDWPDPEDLEFDQYGEFVEVSHTCLDKHLLQLADGSGTRFYLPEPYNVGEYSVDVQLPYGLSCQKCLFQWKWNVANSWGTDPDGTSCIGCGHQEQFYACADIVIDPLDGRQPEFPPFVPEAEPTSPLTLPPLPPPTQRRRQRPRPRTRDPYPPVYSPRAPPPVTVPQWSPLPDGGWGVGGYPTTPALPRTFPGYPNNGYPNNGYPNNGRDPNNRGIPSGGAFPTTRGLPGDREGYPVTEERNRDELPVTRPPNTSQPRRKPSTRRTTTERPEVTEKPSRKPQTQKPRTPSLNFWKWLLVNHPVKNSGMPVVLTRHSQTSKNALADEESSVKESSVNESSRTEAADESLSRRSWWEKLVLLAEQNFWESDKTSKLSSDLRLLPQFKSNTTEEKGTPTRKSSELTPKNTKSSTTRNAGSYTTKRSEQEPTKTPITTPTAEKENTTSFEVVTSVPWWVQNVKLNGPAFFFHEWEAPKQSNKSSESPSISTATEMGGGSMSASIAYSGILGPELPQRRRKHRKRNLTTQQKSGSANQITAAASRDSTHLLMPVPVLTHEAISQSASTTLDQDSRDPFPRMLSQGESVQSASTNIGQDPRDMIYTNEGRVLAASHGFPSDRASRKSFENPEHRTNILPSVPHDHILNPLSSIPPSAQMSGGRNGAQGVNIPTSFSEINPNTDEAGFLPSGLNHGFFAEDLICTPVAGWAQYLQMWNWCEVHCKGGYCPPAYCMCA